METVRGPLHVSWQKSDEDFLLDLLIPVGTSAEIHLPIIWEKSILYLNKRKMWMPGMKKNKNSEIKNLKKKENFLQFEISSGFFNFKLERRKW